MDDLKRFERKAQGRFIMRHDAEYNRDFFQLIPYVLVLNSKGDKVYAARRIGGDPNLSEKAKANGRVWFMLGKIW